jgi:TonB family protein
MANVRPTPTPSPEDADTETAAGVGAVDEQLPALPCAANFSEVVDKLRARATDVQQEMDTLLSGVALAAYELTGATGAALALWTEGAVICRASVGETAPPVGAQLDTDSGISGECLRTGVAQLCFDVERDPRVDAEASRGLGVGSLAAVALHDQGSVKGVLEVLSDRPDAFTQSHVALLEQLAEIAVCGRKAGTATGVLRPASGDPGERATGSLEPEATLRTPIWNNFGFAIKKGGSGNRVVSRIAVLAVLTSLGWMVWRTLHTPTSSVLGKAGTAVEGSANGSRDLVNSGPSLTGAVVGGLGSGSGKPSAQLGTVANDVVMRASSTAALHRDRPLQVVNPAKAGKDTLNSGDEVNPPEVFQLLADPQSNSAQVPTAIVISSVELPKEAPQVSQGVTGGTLVHRVAPTYPRLAKVQKIEGTVALQAIVGEDGGLHEVKVVSGDVVLARAAQQAVAQWRYAPYQLNGKPVSMRTNITVQFRLP